MAVSETDPILKNGAWPTVLMALTWWTDNDDDIAVAKIARPEQARTLAAL